MSQLACGNCGAALVFMGVRTQTCPYCACPSFVEREAGTFVEPVFALGFTRDAQHARSDLRRFLRSRMWFADSALYRATVDDIRGVYLPAYLYSASASTYYTVQIGEHYTETETYEDTDAQGNKTTKTREVTHTEYRPLAGTHVGYVTDVVVSASAGVSHKELGRVEPYDMRELRRFSPALISGWITEEFSRAPAGCRAACQQEARDAIGDKLRRFMPGNSYSELHFSTEISWESMDPILVPIWVIAMKYREGKPPLRIVINGQTGRATGDVPVAWWKVLILVAVLAAIGAVVAFLYARYR